MLAQIIIHTPLWVWGLLLALLALGLNQMVTRTVALRRTTFLPLAMVALSLYGTVSAFGTAPPVLLAWLVAGAAAGALVLKRPLPPGTRFDAASRRFTVPGSAVPLALIVGIFLVKYGVGATLAVQPALAHSADFRLVFGALYGIFSGVFAARAIRLWRLALQHERDASALTA
jgi:preprotein translocase subunit SecF